MKIHYSGQRGGPFGWGVFGENMTKELGKACEIATAESADVNFIPIADHDLRPSTPARCRVNIGMTFFESELGPRAAENAKQYDLILAGSSWCIDRLAEQGITNTHLLIQGVDETIFHAMPPRKKDGQFRIFSGGKFEYRKGQDLVIAAFRELVKHRPNAHLVCAWFNPWPQLIGSMYQSRCIRMPRNAYVNRQWNFTIDIFESNQIYQDDATVLPSIPQNILAAEMANTDCGLFPNRCEGGTNLVLMEYAALGREVIANGLTGHYDIRDAISTPIASRYDERKWAEQDVEDIVESLCAAYDIRDTPPPEIPKWPWANAAAIVLQAANELLEAKS